MIKNAYRYCVMTESLMKEYVNFREKNFVDRVKCTVKAGNGGQGSVTYYRDRIVRSGAPDGGNGGNGGDIYFKAVKTYFDLNHLKKPNYEGIKGGSGQKSQKDGKNGKPLKLSVPIGTLVYEIEGVEEGDRKNKYHGLKKLFIADLDREGKEIIVARGGLGSKGNAKNIGIKVVTPGGAGEEREIYLELRCLADVGLVGYPNAGKSTFLASSSRALPRIAEYPFTTLNPMVGKVCFIDQQDFTIADIPGLIEDAHLDKGLGIEFLRHIERTKVLVYMLDISTQGTETVKILMNEIRHYNPKILEKPFIIVANKQDLIQDAESRFLKLQEDFPGTKCMLISSKHGFNVGKVLVELKSLVMDLRSQETEITRKEQEQFDLETKKRQLLEKQLYKLM